MAGSKRYISFLKNKKTRKVQFDFVELYLFEFHKVLDDFGGKRMFSKDKKKVFLHAYMAGNLGDDLMVRILCERYPKAKFLLYADSSYKERYMDLKNVKVYSPEDKTSRAVNWLTEKIKKTNNGMWKLLIKRSKCTVHIGGSVFVQHSDDFKLAYDVDYDLRARSKKLYVVGANFGPFTHQEYYDAYKELFKKYDGICFRDKYSKSLFEEYENIKYAPDVVFNYVMPTGIESKKQVLFSAVHMEDRGGKYSISQYAEEYYSMLAKMAEYYIKHGYGVKFVSFCKLQKDEEAIEEILSRMEEQYRDSAGKLYYDKDEKPIIQAFVESEMIVGTRFHSIILGWLAGKKVLPIIYDDKIMHVLEDNGYDFYIKMNEIMDLDIDEWSEKLTKHEVFHPEKLVQKASEQFAGLDKLLG